MPSKQSRSLNLPIMVSLSSNPCVITEASLLSNYLIFCLKAIKSLSKDFCVMSIVSYGKFLNPSTAFLNSSKICFNVYVKVLPFVPPNSIFSNLLNCIMVVVRWRISWHLYE